MNEQLKITIASGVVSYAKSKELSQNDIARQSGVNAGYVSAICRNQFTTEVNNKAVPIGDRWFYKLAAWAGISFKKEYWQMVDTIQFREIIHALNQAKKTPRALLLIGETGCGKTEVVTAFCNKNPKNTYRVTVGDSYKQEDLLQKLMEVMDIEAKLYRGSKRIISTMQMLEMIANKVIEIKQDGGSPLIILDEAENLKPKVLKSIKELYDYIIQWCSLVLIGTDQILDSMLNLRNKNRQSVPQVYRRFKAGIVEITPIVKVRDFAPFLKLFVHDADLRKLLIAKADNYGELHDFLEPALRIADETNQPLTHELFCTIYNINLNIKAA